MKEELNKLNKIEITKSDIQLSSSEVEEINEKTDDTMIELYHLNKILADEKTPKYPPYTGPKYHPQDVDIEEIEAWKAVYMKPRPLDTEKINRLEQKIKNLENTIKPVEKLKYSEYFVVFSEFPDEITLAFNITNCPHRCKGCHSPWLQENTGTELTHEVLYDIISKTNNNISCVGFMGGDSSVSELNKLAKFIKEKYNGEIKTGWYSGNDEIDENIDLNYFDYIKIGHYDKERGPLNTCTTNQILYKLDENKKLCNITYKLWK